MPVIRPIGIVRSPFTDSRAAPHQSRLAPRAEASIVIEDPYRRGLDDLVGFDYVWIIAWLDRPHDPPEDPERVVPMRRSDGRTISVFGTRCPIRQNPVAITLSELLHLDLTRGILEIRGVDLADGTPVLDVKPYVPAFDRPHGGAPVAAGWYDEDHLAAPLPIEAARTEALEAAERWIGASRPFVVIQTLHQHGPGVRRGGELCVATTSEVGGEVLGGAVRREEILSLARQALTSSAGVVAPVTVDTKWAARHALGPGREVEAVASLGLDVPAKFWECLRADSPVALAVALDGVHEPSVFEPEAGFGPLADVASVQEVAAQLLGLRYEAVRFVDDVRPRVALQSFFPIPTLLLAGWPALGSVIAEVARPMGWRCITVPVPDEAVSVCRALSRLDAVVVLGHDPALDEPVLEAALRHGGPAFVAATGSASVVGDRKRRLAARGVGADAVARLRSPVGLPIGGATAPEIALSVVAELQAFRYG